MPCDVYTDLTVNGTLHGHSQRDKRIMFISTLTSFNEQEGRWGLASAFQPSRHLPMPLVGNHTIPLKLWRTGVGGNSLEFLPEATICTEQVLPLEHLVSPELILSEDSYTSFGPLLIHCHLTFCLSALGSLSRLPKNKKQHRSAKSILMTLLLGIVFWILLWAPHAVNKPCELFDIQPFLTFQSSNSIWFKLTHAVSSAWKCLLQAALPIMHTLASLTHHSQDLSFLRMSIPSMIVLCDPNHCLATALILFIMSCFWLIISMTLLPLARW